MDERQNWELMGVVHRYEVQALRKKLAQTLNAVKIINGLLKADMEDYLDLSESEQRAVKYLLEVAK